MRILPKRDRIVQRHDLTFCSLGFVLAVLTYAYAKIVRRIRPLALRRSDMFIELVEIEASHSFIGVPCLFG